MNLEGCGCALLCIFPGAAIGAVGFSTVVWQVEAAKYPGWNTDGQSGLILLETIPIGGVLGAIVGLGFGLWLGSRYRVE